MTGVPEFSRMIAIASLGTGESGQRIEADPEERAALARRFGLEALNRLSADAAMRREGETVFARGSVEAEVVQTCVVTGEPVTSAVAEPFDLRFVPEGSETAGDEEIELSEEECETLRYEDAAVDLGETAAQTMALALDPFPRSENADAALREAGVLGEAEAGPFGALKGLRDAMKKEGSD